MTDEKTLLTFIKLKSYESIFPITVQRIHELTGFATQKGWYHADFFVERLINQLVNSLAPGRFQFIFRWVILKLILMNGGWGISYQIALRWMPLDLTDDNSTLVQVMACCYQATSYYLSQCWPRYMSPNGINRPQWDNHWLLGDLLMIF